MNPSCSCFPFSKSRAAACSLALGLSLLPAAAVRLRAEPPAVMAQVAGPGADALARADTDFAKLAAEQGNAKAFETYLSADSVNPLPDREAPQGKQIVVDRMKKLDESGLLLAWSPAKAEAAASGDLGYTYGNWELHKKGGGPVVARGHYCTIWKKQTDGSWRAIFDMGNETPEPSAP